MTDVESDTNSGLPEGMAAPSVEAQELAAKARVELQARGGDVWVETKWWGFQVHMNEATAADFSDVVDRVGDIIEGTIPKIGRALAAVMKLHSMWIKAVNGPTGVKCSSPWFAPSLLIPSSRGGVVGDPKLWWTVYEPGPGWSPDEKFAAHYSGSNPALAAFNGRLYLAHRGSDAGGGDAQLWWAVYDAQSGWSEDQVFPGHSSSHGPALAVFNGKLHCVHRGVAGDERLWHSTFDGTRWSADTPLPAHGSSVGPALAVFKNKLYLVHRGGGSDGRLWWSTFDGTRWSNDTPLGSHSTASNPALAVYGDKLHCLHRGGGSDTILYHTTTVDGVNWSADTKLPAHNSLEGPGLTVYDNKLYCVHRGYGGGDQHLWWSYYNGSSWSGDTKFPDHTSGAGPAVIAYRDPNGTRDQLLVVHRGYGARAAGTDTAEDEARLAAEASTPEQAE
ncbi:hypothetical protein ACFWA9_13275 [Kitasatospora sp. NPDC059973]|uniref:hypothetical protein n=1 Tax=Kitasatospora sp. NPDC059973 TaxID=3347020 RepID=UPI00368F259C